MFCYAAIERVPAAQIGRALADLRANLALVGITLAQPSLIGPVLPKVGLQLSFIGPTLPFIGLSLAFIGRPFAFVGDPVSFVGNPFAFVGESVAFVSLAVSDSGVDLTLVGPCFALGDVGPSVRHDSTLVLRAQR